MNGVMLTVGVGYSALEMLLVDSAIKGTALLLLAVVAAMILRLDSAATRHLVWLLALFAMLVVPVLSATLPQWRVLPVWARSLPQPEALEINNRSVARPADVALELPQNAEPVEIEPPFAAANHPAIELPVSQPPLVAQEIIPESVAWNWLNGLSLVWAIGFCWLLLRLMAARLMLWSHECHGTVIWSPRHPVNATDDRIVTAVESACLQLGIRRAVTLLMHPDKSIPVVWGIFRCRLMLPVVAREWTGEKLRSVLLHEFAHIKRRDTMAQLLAQLACALHWFNPLAWFAAWRLGVECERACDDLVLASGVRPSSYAGHLLEAVTGLSPVRWTQSCGLAMARKSSLEGRLVAVLKEGLNRRGVSLSLCVIALVIAVGIAVPIAMLRAADEKAATPSQQVAQTPKTGAKLQPATEQKLKWGEPATGLRMALAWPPSLGEPGMGDVQEFYLVVQNVSQATVRLTANGDAPNPRTLIMRNNGAPLSAISDTVPLPGDWLLQPREVAFLRLFQPGEKTKDGRTVSAVIEQDIRVFPQYSMTAEMSIEKAPAGAWTGKLVTGQTRGSVDVIPPKHKDAQALFKSWTTAARGDGKIPGAVIALLGQSVTTFIKNNPTWKTTPQLEKLLPRFDGSRDWSGPDAVALLDELAALQDTPIGMALDHESDGIIRTGTPLPAQLANAPWGEALSNGLRLAWLLEPRAAEHRLGTPLTARILIHNSGKTPVVFRTWSWHQCEHTAHDASGAEIKLESTHWLTRGQLTPFRLAPGEFVELNGPGIGVGPVGNHEDWQQTRVGTWVEAKSGDDVTVTTSPVPLYDWSEKPELLGDPQWWWLDFINARLARHLPLPADAAARKLLLYRIAMELFGTPVGDEINAAFVADRESTAVDSLAMRLFHRPGLNAWAGALTSGPTTFRVLPADPDAAKKPRTASNPGRYTLDENATLVVTRRPDGERIVNEARIQFSSPDATKPAPGEPHEIKLPDGYNTWAAAWVRGGTVLWLLQKGNVRSYDFTNSMQVKETVFDEPVRVEDVPRPILDALRGALDVAGAPKPAPAASRNGRRR